jgi:selenocysteine lyase/cysteine desulfurase
MTVSINQNPTFQITGSAAKSRIAPLLPPNWVEGDTNVDFLWENAPRAVTKSFRDNVACYSHLPNGTNILDSKWVLARLFQDAHCFTGLAGFQQFCRRQQCSSAVVDDESFPQRCPDLFPGYESTEISTDFSDWWVVKDASSNGAGGVWVVSPQNRLFYQDARTSPFIENHRYVAQPYAWPLVLFQGRKCHVRVYGLITSDGRAFVHDRAFLHVANEAFTGKNVQATVHITNCCANSHDLAQFSGEICAHFGVDSNRLTAEGEIEIGLARYKQAIHHKVAQLAERTGPFLKGGQKNGGFEYMGLDFILTGDDSAFLLEVNAPPSQDTATGLPHAEALHDAVIHDLLHLWVYPRILGQPEQPGDWQCVYTPSAVEILKMSVVPSKAALVNKMRWALLERKLSKVQDNEEPMLREESFCVPGIRKRFQYFQNSKSKPLIYFENAGGTQVPVSVVNAVQSSLNLRDRSIQGKACVASARTTLQLLLGAQKSHVFLGANASQLISNLADAYVDLLSSDDEIVISTDNHLANIHPWRKVATRSGATIQWWNPIQEEFPLLSESTRLVIIPHASNVLGKIRDLRSFQRHVLHETRGRARTVVDGVAVVPHRFAAVDANGVDWYVISCHKVFGPHLGALCGRPEVLEELSCSLEYGTLNYEACAGISGLSQYFSALASLRPSQIDVDDECLSFSRSGGGKESIQRTVCEPIGSLSPEIVKDAYQLICRVELPLTKMLIEGLQRSTKVSVFASKQPCLDEQLPIVSFVHSDLDGGVIVEACRRAGIICRCGSFLCSEQLMEQLKFQRVVRFSLVHYNTAKEVSYALKILQSLENWF